MGAKSVQKMLQKPVLKTGVHSTRVRNLPVKEHGPILVHCGDLRRLLVQVQSDRDHAPSPAVRNVFVCIPLSRLPGRIFLAAGYRYGRLMPPTF